MKKYYLLLLFFTFCIKIFSQQVETLSLKNDSGIFVKNWELYYIQNPNGLIGSTTPVHIEKPSIDAKLIDRSTYKGVCWFKKTVRFDSSIVNKSLSVHLKLIGAAEIFINKKKVQSIGVVSASEDTEEMVNTNRYLFIYKFEPGINYEILIRYSNHNLESSYTSNGQNLFGINFEIIETERGFYSVMKDRVDSATIGALLIMFFLTLFFIHLAIFLFNTKQPSNIYYAGFCLIISLMLIAAFGNKYTTMQSILSITGLFAVLAPTFVMCIVPFMLRSFFTLKIPSWYKIILILSCLCLVLLFTGVDFYSYFFLALVAVSAVEIIRNLILAFRQKKTGVKIIGTGIILFIVSLILLISIIIYYSTGDPNTNVKSENAGIMVFILLLTSVFSIPLSITVFLAYSISVTNKSLANKLIEVEELSAKSIEQEKEKQLILENQNTTLEKQVTERTFEIREQKKIIEEKNKDIIDSINYAKRIQSAMLPEETAFKAIFNNSFVLYMPRDIVSGDFYYATEINGNKLIIAADCTGHGVPGALMSMVGCNIINKLTFENKIVEPKIILESLHTQLRQALKQDLKGSVNRDGMDVAAVLINDTNIIYASANRPLVYFDNENNLHEIKATKTPIGGSHIETVNIEQHVLPKNNVKQFYLFSDGFADQFGGPEGKKLMVSKFKIWLSQIVNLSVTEQHQFLQNNFIDWKKESEQVDDVMVIGIKV